jgi:L-ascorbate metabolism protein UlaG (beta-lactamase superfamily)
MSRKVTGPAIAASDIAPIDAVLLSHDHHGDNLDAAGRALLPSAGVVVTTASGAKRLGANARGLEPWATTRLDAAARPPIEITATPCRHGPPLSRPIAGDVIGFALQWDGQERGVLWISGDTVLYNGVRQVAERLQVDIALMHLGCVRFPVTGPVRYSMTAQEAVELCRLMRPRTAIPVHYEGWTHFRQGRDAMEREFARAPDDIRQRIRWLPIGVEVTV